MMEQNEPSVSETAAGEPERYPDYHEALEIIRKLPPKQRVVFDQICCNNDGGHHPATLQALERRGLICSYPQTARRPIPGAHQTL